MSLVVGMGPGYSIAATVAASADFAPLVVTNPRLVVLKPGGERAQWAGTIEAATSGSVSTRFAFPNAEEPSIAGQWKAYVLFDAPGGATKRSTTFQFSVDKEF